MTDALLYFETALNGSNARLVPWLQDFSLGRTYTAADVRAQVDAARTLDTRGFLLWNPLGLYTHERALRAVRPTHPIAWSAWPSRARSTCRPRFRGRSRRRSSSARSASIADPLSIYAPVVIAEGRGATITDVDGNTFLDFTGGVGCLNVGHSHPRVVEAAQAQLERFSHTDFTIVPYEVYVELAERLTRARAGAQAGEGGVLQRGHRGGRELGQVRARVHRSGRP